ncbi:MAG: hypothetical protein SFZ03_03365 [Candidatus Melainabacteria bacterium]|nr:hypothetical protein [Candidatus Melainabacteria bacterium]
MPGELIQQIPLRYTAPPISTQTITTGTAADLLREVVPLRETSPATPNDSESTVQDGLDAVARMINNEVNPDRDVILYPAEWQEMPLNTIPGGEGVSPDPNGIRVFQDVANPGSYQITDPDWQEPLIYHGADGMAIDSEDSTLNILDVNPRDDEVSIEGVVALQSISLDGNRVEVIGVMPFLPEIRITF